MIIYICPQCNVLCTNKAKHNLSHSVNGNPGAWVEIDLVEASFESVAITTDSEPEILDEERNV